jgi:hypothetical protein
MAALPASAQFFAWFHPVVSMTFPGRPQTVVAPAVVRHVGFQGVPRLVSPTGHTDESLPVRVRKRLLRLPLRYGLREEGRDRRKVGAAFIAVTSLVADNVEVDRPLQE